MDRMYTVGRLSIYGDLLQTRVDTLCNNKQASCQNFNWYGCLLILIIAISLIRNATSFLQFDVTENLCKKCGEST